MAKKKNVHKVGPLNENKKNIISALIEEYDIETADGIQAALCDLLGGTIKVPIIKRPISFLVK